MNKQEGGGEARFEIAFDEARMVRAAVCLGRSRTLHEESKCVAACTKPTSERKRAKRTPDHKTIWDMLKNPAYKGEAAFGKTRWTAVGSRLRAPRGRPAE